MKKFHIIFKFLFCSVILLNHGFINAQCNLLCNMDFDNSQLASPASYIIVDESQVPCWNTTATDNQIEIWSSGFGGVPSYSGNQFIELNAYMVSTIYQNFTVSPGTALTVSFAHRGRDGVDVMSLDIGPVGGPYTTLGSYSDGNTSWGFYTETYTIPFGQGNNYSLRFNSLSSAGGPASGNFLDAISVSLPYTVTLTTSATNASCGLSNGTATVTATGGVLPYTYSWNSSPVQPLQAATGLTAGSYTVTVADSNGCVKTGSVSVNAGTQPDVEVSAGLSSLCDSTKLSWASWSSVNSTTGNGVISSDLSVTVTKPTGGLSTTGGMYNPTLFPSQYNVPVNNTAIRNDLAGLFTFCFNRPVVNPQIALSSIGQPGQSVQVNTSVPYGVIWQGQGMTYANSNTFIGAEGYTILQFPGMHTCISFDYLQSETYCNLAFGTLDTNCQALAPPPMCAGQSDTLTASGAATYSWTPAAGLNTTTGAVVIATPAVTTTYYVTGSNGIGCSDTDSIKITVEPQPAATITGDTIICAGDSTILTASGGVSYVWNPGNITGAAPKLKPLTTTTYTVVATNAAGCDASAVIKVTVNPLPAVAVTPPSPAICIGSSQILTASGASTYSWSLPAGLNATTGVSVTANPLLTTTYTLTGIDTQGCADTATVAVIVNPKPIVNLQAGTVSVCFGKSDTLKASGALTYSWTPAAGLNTTNGAVVVATPTVTTTYYVTGVDVNSCTDTASITIQVHPLPVATIIGDTVICAGDSTTLTAHGGDDYLWKPLNLPDSAITIRPINNTVYIAVVTSAVGCVDSASIHVIVNPVPDAQFSVAPVCRTEPSVFMNTSTGNIASWSWSYDDGTVASVQNPVHTYATCDSFSVKLLVTTVDGCIDSISKPARVYCLPVADFGLSDACMNEPVVFSDLTTISGGTVTTWDWDYGDNSAPGNSQNPSHPYSTYGSFNISLITTTNQGCRDTALHNINIHPLPIPHFTANNVCAGSIVPFANQSIIAPPDMLQSWVWDFADGTPVYNNPNILHAYPNTGSYTVELTVVSDFGCADSLTQTIIVNPNPVVDFTATDTVNCAPLCLSFSEMASITPPPAGNVHWAWNLGDSSGTVNSLSFDHCYQNLSALNTAYYSVSLTVTSDSGCVTTKIKNNYITVYPNPVAQFVADPAETNSVNPIITISNQSVGATIWDWTYGDADTASGFAPSSHTYADTGTYTITLITENQHGCKDTTFQNVIVAPSFTFYIPSAFTPNGDGVNDFFSGQGTFIKEYTMSIFDRWGNFIFYTDDIEKPWDGTANYETILAQQDTYIYTIVITDIKKQKHRYNGIVTLVGGKAN